jgi:hypothetical protein
VHLLTLELCVLVGLAVPATVPAAEPEPMLSTTTAPIIYTVNYSGDYFKRAGYIDRFRVHPPDLLHAGNATPITHL